MRFRRSNPSTQSSPHTTGLCRMTAACERRAHAPRRADTRGLSNRLDEVELAVLVAPPLVREPRGAFHTKGNGVTPIVLGRDGGAARGGCPDSFGLGRFRELPLPEGVEPFALSVAAIRVLARVQLCKVDSGRS